MRQRITPADKPLLLLIVVLVLGGVAWWVWPRDDARSHANASAGAPADSPARGQPRASDEAPPLVGLAAKPKAAIAGQVRTSADQPLAGAQVCAWPSADALLGLASPEPQCVTTDRSGRYRIEGLWPVRTTIGASAAAHLPQRFTALVQGRPLSVFPLAAGRTREAVDFTLAPGGVELVGVVRDLGGGEIEGALVRNESGASIVFARSDAEGRFSLWVEPDEHTLLARAEGYANAIAYTHAPTELAELYMMPESAVIGRVVDADSGEPIADIEVSAGAMSSSLESVRSDAEGRFRIGMLRPGTYKPTARAEGLYGVAEVAVHLGFAQTSTPVLVRVHRVASVRGRVVIAPQQAPCPLGKVALQQTEDRSIRANSVLDESGAFAMFVVFAGTYDVEVTCYGYVSRAVDEPIVVGDQPIEDVVLAVDEGQRITGRVVGHDGAGVGDVDVTARMVADADDARGQLTTERGTTLADGSFEIHGLLPGRYRVSAGGGVVAPERPLELELPPGVDLHDVRIELLESGSVSGRVVDAAGVAQRGVAVVVRKGKWGSDEVLSDDEGCFVIESLRPGEARVLAERGRFGEGSLRAPGTSDDDVQGVPVEIVAGQRSEVELVVESRTGSIRGRVRDEQGSPVADAVLIAERMSDSATANPNNARALARNPSGGAPTLSDLDGTFTIEALAPGNYVVRAQRRGGGEAMLEQVELGSSIELTIAPNGLLAGLVVVGGGEPPERFSVSAEDLAQGISLRDTFFRTSGRWQLGELPAGHYRVSASAGSGSATLELELAAGERRDDLELDLTALVTVSGRLVDIDTRAPIPGMLVSVSSRNAASQRHQGLGRAGDLELISDAEGRFTFGGAPTGKVDIRVSPRPRGSDSRYSRTSFPRELADAPSEQDVGDLELIASRLALDQSAGELGFELAQRELGTEPEQVRLRVGFIRPGGPASATALALGDEIEQVDGKSVVGVDASRFAMLTSVPPGATIELTLAGGKRVSITAGPPLE